MSLLNPTTRLKIWTGISLSIFALLQLTSCSSKHEFLVSSVEPAARGYAKVNRDKNENYLIHLNVEYLAEPERLDPPRETYVVWLDTKEKEPKNIGQIHHDKHSEAKNLKFSFETVSVYDPVRIYITAENDAAVSEPNEPIILSTGKIKS